jgi:hypothetical protein
MSMTSPDPSLFNPASDPSRILGELESLIQSRSSGAQTETVLQLVDAALKLAREETSLQDLKMIRHALLELRLAFKVFAPYRRIRKVSIFGSARSTSDGPHFRQATLFANRMTRLGFMVITGAGGGIMAAAQGGAGRARSFGVNIRLPFEQRANEVIEDDPKLLHFKYFFTRKVIFVKETDAIAIFPGGFGTHDEAFESLTLVQTGKTDLLPIVFLDAPGGSYWQDWVAYLRKHLLGSGYIAPEDLCLFEVTDDVDKAAEAIQRFYSNYHSLSYVDRLLVLRLQDPPSEAQIEHLNAQFADIVTEGRFESIGAEPDPEDGKGNGAGLHRIAFAFDRKSYGRLRQLVEYLNATRCP